MLGGLVFLTLTGVLIVTLYTVFRNTTELLDDKSRLLLGSLTTATSRYLDATRAQVDYIAGLIERGELDPDDDRRMYEILSAGLAATPQVSAVLFIDARGWMLLAARQPDGTIARDRNDWQADPQVAAAMADVESRGSNEAFWGPPVYADVAGTILNLRRPVRGARFARHGGRHAPDRRAVRVRHEPGERDRANRLHSVRSRVTCSPTALWSTASRV